MPEQDSQQPSDPEQMGRVQVLQQEYWQLAHAVQSGVSYILENIDQDSGAPKHLRTGINMAMVQVGALVQLLVSKGIITEEEWWEAHVKMLREEVSNYESEIRKVVGMAVTLR